MIKPFPSFVYIVECIREVLRIHGAIAIRIRPMGSGYMTPIGWRDEQHNPTPTADNDNAPQA